MIFSENALKDMHVLVTGATGEIGAETARAAAAAGAAVSITGRNEDKLNALAEELASQVGKEKIYMKAADLNKEEDRVMLVKSCQEQLGFISGLVNCAGIAGGDVLENLEEEKLADIMETNLTSVVMLTKLVYQRMAEKQKGRIVNVSSLSGIRGTHGNSAYAASKFALRGFAQSLAVEGARNHVIVNTVCPGFVHTRMAKDAIRRKAEGNGISFEQQLSQVEEDLPSGRITEPWEVANTICFLLTEAAPNIIGESILLSGGSVMK
ncbi:SDR family NAD(P)-dependent oxidoreductase [Bacillus lacus]|uniref:SDR family NAD(P)-dependent oxidoreductase n=1 Tax=Metabacillus lacus TaxID=1983721 RepID=A0A7X2J2H3_9BACI|nr:SDR family oxidoreductase [Metabacillus lacus]MRX74160.1 SDR family NAD(P)-dependent oxidoreductase [Metabacillus lacus]